MNYPATSTTITLSRPVDLNGETVTSLPLREPPVRDKIMFEKANVRATADCRPCWYPLLVPADACRAAGAAGERVPDVPPPGDKTE